MMNWKVKGMAKTGRDTLAPMIERTVNNEIYVMSRVDSFIKIASAFFELIMTKNPKFVNLVLI